MKTFFKSILLHFTSVFDIILLIIDMSHLHLLVYSYLKKNKSNDLQRKHSISLFNNILFTFRKKKRHFRRQE